MFPRSPTGAYRLPALALGGGGAYLMFVLAREFHVEALMGVSTNQIKSGVSGGFDHDSGAW